MLQDKLHVLLLVFPYLKRNSPPFSQLLQKELHELPRRVWKWLYRSYGNDYNGVSTKKWSVNKNFNQISKNRFQLKQLIPKGHSLRKQPTFRDDTTSFPVKWRPRNDTTCQIGVVLRIGWKFASTNQKHYPDLGSDASSVWNFCTRFSDVIWRETSGDVAKCRLLSKAKQNTTE